MTEIPLHPDQTGSPVRRQWPWLPTIAAILLWWRLPGTVASHLFILLWLATAQLIFFGLLETARLRRRAWLGQYLMKDSPWYRRLRGGALMVIWNQSLSAGLALMLLVLLRHLTPWDALLLLLALGLFILLGGRMSKVAARHVRPRYQAALTRRLLVPVVALPLTLALAAAKLWRPQPYLVQTSWAEALQQHMTSSAGPTLLGTFERVASAVELSGFWIMQNALEATGVDGPAAALGWVLLFVTQGALAWSFVRLLAGQAALIHRLSPTAAHALSKQTHTSQDDFHP